MPQFEQTNSKIPFRCPVIWLQLKYCILAKSFTALSVLSLFSIAVRSNWAALSRSFSINCTRLARAYGVEPFGMPLTLAYSRHFSYDSLAVWQFGLISITFLI